MLICMPKPQWVLIINNTENVRVQNSFAEPQ